MIMTDDKLSVISRGNRQLSCQNRFLRPTNQPTFSTVEGELTTNKSCTKQTACTQSSITCCLYISINLLHSENQSETILQALALPYTLRSGGQTHSRCRRSDMNWRSQDKMRTDHLAVFLLFFPLANLNPKVNLCCRQNHAYKLHDEITTTKEHRCDEEPQVACLLSPYLPWIIISYQTNQAATTFYFGACIVFFI